MEKVVYKYKLENEAVQSLDLPMGSEFLTADTQFTPDQFNPSSGSEDVYLWFLVPTDESVMKTKRILLILPTGKKIKDDKSNLKYLKTIFFKKIKEVYHIFESE